MGLDFGKSSMGNPAQAGNGLQEKNEIEVVEKYDIVADRQQMNAELVNSKEVDDIVSTIEVYNMDTIVSFGAKAAEEISKASDVVLNSMNMSQLNETIEMLSHRHKSSVPDHPWYVPVHPALQISHHSLHDVQRFLFLQSCPDHMRALADQILPLHSL